MQKTIFSKDYRLLLDQLRAARERAGLTQLDVAERLGQSQSFVSKCERGERRIDAVELRAFCLALGISYVGFLKKFDDSLRR